MIYECISRHRRVIHSMIYQVCDLDKKILQKSILFCSIFWSGLRGERRNKQLITVCFKRSLAPASRASEACPREAMRHRSRLERTRHRISNEVLWSGETPLPARRPAIKQVCRTMLALTGKWCRLRLMMHLRLWCCAFGTVGKHHITCDHREQHHYECSE